PGRRGPEIDGHDLGGGVEDGLLDGLAGHVEGRAAAAADHDFAVRHPGLVDALERRPGGPELSPQTLERLGDALLRRHRVETVEDEEARQQVVLGQAADDQVARRLPGHEGQDPLQAGAVELDEEVDELLGPFQGPGLRGRPQFGQQVLHPGTDVMQILRHRPPPTRGAPPPENPPTAWRRLRRQFSWGGPRGGGAPPSAQISVCIIVGLWSFFNTFPLPRYMCTPQGRQGSKLRTARMMSMPLKLSGSFSSKIGVFWTASS